MELSIRTVSDRSPPILAAEAVSEPVSVPHSCKHCQQIVIEPPSSFAEEAASTSFVYYTLSIQVTSAEFRNAFEGGCLLFRYIHQKLQLGPSKHDAKSGDMIDNQFPRLYIELFEVFGDTIIRFTEGDSTVDLRMFTTAGSRFAQEIKNRPRSHHVLCQETVDQVRNWLTTCHSSHHCPYRASDPKLPPSRLIKIRAEGGQFHPILYETKGASDLCWCALSYCWGGDQLIKTTKATYNRYLAGLRFDDLPRTLQDAIRVTNCLGAEFLWIDCLCIIQDDENDIANELAQMPEIYRNAWLTIIASTAATCYDGFLQDRELFSPGSSPFLCSMLYTSRHGEVGPVMVTESADSSSLEPIDARAWTLQEGRLSPRIIEFAQGQLRWRCLSDSGYDGDYPGKNDRHDMYTARNFISHRDPQLQDPETFTKTWANVVENYTGRHLSVYTDKLPAISAVAQEFAHVRGDRYIAGLWEAELPDSLLWSTIPHPPQSTTYIGPSWSWASANGITQLWSKRADSVVGAQSLKTLKFVAIIRTCSVQPVHPNAPFGAVKSGILVIEGYIKRGFWFYRHKGRVVQSIPDTKGTKIRGGIGSGDVDSGALVENDHPEANLTMTVDCLKIADWSGGSAGLLLVQADASSITRYRRVGLLDSNGTSDQRFWDDAQWAKVEIV